VRDKTNAGKKPERAPCPEDWVVMDEFNEFPSTIKKLPYN